MPGQKLKKFQGIGVRCQQVSPKQDPAAPARPHRTPDITLRHYQGRKTTKMGFIGAEKQLPNFLFQY